MDAIGVNKQTLYVVATPIGNLADISQRAIDVLNSVDLICCEDTRHSARLMDHIGCRTKLISLHEHNERDKSDYIVKKLQGGHSIALVSDAGTPLISDPGYVLVNHVINAGMNVAPLPGPSAVVTALSVAGLPTDRWRFEGFLPNKTGARVKVLEALVSESCTLVFYESSHRISASLSDMEAVFGSERPIVIARELTKTFETVLRGSVAQVRELVDQDANQRKGEFVVLVQGDKDVQLLLEDPKAVLLAKELKPLLPPKKAAAVLASVFGGSKKDYYQYLLELE